MLNEVLINAVVAGLLASLACGLGALPLAIPRLDPARHSGVGYAGAAGLMFAASVYNLILPALQPDFGGIVTAGGTVWTLGRMLPILGGLLIFLAMCVHSIPEGVAVGVGYTAEGTEYSSNPNLGNYLALAIAIHNIPEGLAVAIPLRAAGVSLPKCFGLAVLTSLPQPIAAVPAVLTAFWIQPLIPWLMAFAAGAMIFLVIEELLPEALEKIGPQKAAWSFTLGFGGMMLIQTVL